MASIVGLARPISMVLSREKKPSVISLQINMMGKKVAEVQEKLGTLSTLSEYEPERIVSDAIDLLAHYRYAVSQLMIPARRRDSNVRYFDEDNSRIAVNENPTPEEIARCQELFTQIESCGLDLAKAQDLISYRGETYEIEEVAAKIRQVVSQCLPSIRSSFHAIGNASTIRKQAWEGWICATKELNELIKIIYSMINDHQLGIINSFTVDGKSRFIQAALCADEKVDEIICFLSRLTEKKIKCSSIQKIRTQIRSIINEMNGRIQASHRALDSGLEPEESIYSRPDIRGVEDCMPTPAALVTTIPHPMDGFPEDKQHLILPPAGMDPTLVSTFRRYEICLVTPDKLAPKASSPVHTISALFSTGGRCEIRSCIPWEGAEKERSVLSAAEKLIDKMKSLGQPVTAIVSSAPRVDSPSLQACFASRASALKPKSMSVILVDTLFKLGIGLVDPRKLMGRPDSDGYRTGFPGANLLSMERSSVSGWGYYVSYSATLITFEQEDEITNAAEELIRELGSKAPAAALLSWS